MIATPLESAPPQLVVRWRRWHEALGGDVHQSHAYAVAVARVRGATWVVADDETIGAFAVADGVATSLSGTRTALSVVTPSPRRLERICEALADVSGAGLVYFPHVHADAAPQLPEGSRMAAWTRLPSPHVDCRPGDDLWARVQERYGSRAARQRRRAEACGLVQRRLAGEAAVAVVDHVERRSWKARAGQSMHHRDDQYALHAQMLRDGLTSVSALLDGDRPVAYRLDAQARRTVACLKWSYDDDYRRCSPGFYLLTCGLAHDWDHRAVDRIDLFGSPDQLKRLVATGEMRRVDLAWPAEAAVTLAAERRAHDRRAAAALRDGMGLRRLYGDDGTAPARGVATDG